MKLACIRLPTGRETVGLVQDAHVIPVAPTAHYQTLTDVLETVDPAETARFLFSDRTARVALDEVTVLAPIDRQEVWAAGVTYTRSRTARMEESQDAETFYDKVYAADRPELFLKATPHRVVGPEQAVRIRQDAQWSVPEPELALVLDSELRLVGFTIGNDMSSRDIEGENPLYLPQAKVYDACCALGPFVTLAEYMPPREEIGIRMLVRRRYAVVCEGQTSVSQMARSFEDLIAYLGRDNRFPHGVVLLTGTGIVPDSSFTLHPGDEIEIEVDGIGKLVNPVIRG